MTLGAHVAGQMAEAIEAFKRGAEALRTAAAHVRLDPIAGLDPEALATFAAVTDANRGGIERMEERVRRLLPKTTTARPAQDPDA